MKKTEFQSNSIKRDQAMAATYATAYGIKPTAEWPFPTDEVFYENPRNSIRRFQLEQGRTKIVPNFVPKFNPIDGFISTFNLSNPDPSYDQTGNKQLMEALKKQGFPKLKKETDPDGKTQNSPGAKVDAGKDRVWLFLSGFSRALKEVSKVNTVGADKYTPDGWVTVRNGQSRYMDAFGRHLLDLGGGATIDDGPGGTHCLHKAQMIWNLLASLELELREKENESA